jgi:tRNA uridine 5-carboxymethylaminomethyl modification enzyme
LDLLKQAEFFKSLIMETKVKPDFSFWNKITDISEKRGYRISELALRPQVTDQMLISQFADLQKFPKPVREYVWNELKLAGYLQRQSSQRTEHQWLEAIKIPADFNYQDLSGLSETGLQKLEKVRPVSLGQAFRIPGLEPSDQTVLLLYFNPIKGDPVTSHERAI